MAINFTLNGKKTQVEAAPDTPLLWVLRDELQMTGTKFGCGIAQCGACTVHFNGNAMRSCSLPVQAVEGQAITTIEGEDSAEAKALQAAWDDLAVYQCGYCQSGQLMSASKLLKDKPSPSDDDIDQFMSGNICRCSTYQRIRAGIKQAASDLATEVTS
ncbi:aerobic-type carbon monoxide dehydrogenase, small subunit CoxS/CutS-like protein [Spongiibacter sp. IMCC21906]|jgi:isoquinoline 1-oxidoreductase alpha subunit|uniref:(2Fe-2S)-binding protein n=1 Tax=Spongiibacter sp. IMCC21906 TaxID=1620392 RepID=UPI00062DE6CE|nr:(2Fe-2S)-binding protein [Spongiibacter sp. IMCC21906]AKH67725.1 aerobic-type carbon monoxide dehydrogenase, small subunit CoxS/CutS-like protein [Spongiibacter sp. IMCC21906]